MGSMGRKRLMPGDSVVVDGCHGLVVAITEQFVRGEVIKDGAVVLCRYPRWHTRSGQLAVYFVARSGLRLVARFVRR
jgi:hypothetical protein